jgi:uncharacterized protein (TIGR02246 family)
MKKTSIAALWVLIALSFSCAPARQEEPAPPPAPTPQEETAEVHAAAQVRLKAIETGDVEAYLSVYADDAVWMPPAAMEIVGKEAARRRISQSFDAATLEPVIQSREQTVMSPDWVADRGQYAILVTPKQGGESRQTVGSFLTLWHRDDGGKWKIFFDIWNTDNPVVDVSQAK